MKVNVSDGAQQPNVGTKICLNDALEIVGSHGQYQWRVFLIVSLVVAIQSLVISGQAYTFIYPPLLCNGQSCDEINDFCSGNYEISVDPKFGYRNFVTQFELYCDKKFYITVAQSIYFLGNILGGSYMTYLADKIGRRIAYIISWGIALIGVIGVTTSFSIYQYVIMNFLIGFGATPCYIINYVILNEISATGFRQKASVGLLIAWGGSEIVCAYLFYAVEHWRIIYIGITALTMLSFIGCYLFVYETPQFYLTKQEFTKGLDQIAKINGRADYSSVNPQSKERIDTSLVSAPPERYTDHLNNIKAYSVVDLFYYPSLRKASFGFMVISFTLHIIYYGGMSDISSGNQIYILGAIMGLAEVIAYFLIKSCIHLLPRRKSIIWSYIMSISACLCFLFFGFSAQATQIDQILVILIACSVRVFNSFAFAIQGLYANEFYPTVVRSLGTGLLFSLGFLGSFFAPYTIALGESIKINPYILFALLGLMGPLGTLLIKETLGKRLKDQIHEINKEEVEDEKQSNFIASKSEKQI